MSVLDLIIVVVLMLFAALFGIHLFVIGFVVPASILLIVLHRLGVREYISITIGKKKINLNTQDVGIVLLVLSVLFLITV